MRKTVLVSAMSLAFLVLTSCVGYVLRATKLNATTLLIGGAIILVVSAIMAIFVKKNIAGNVLCFIVSAVALGFCIRAWYVFRGFDNSLWVMLAVSLASVAQLWLFYGLSRITALQKHFALYFWLFLLLSVVAYVLVMAFTVTTYVSTFGYYMIVQTAFIFALCSFCEDTADTVRRVTVASYSVLIVAVIMAIVMISGDGADLDLSGVGDIAVDVPDVRKRNKK